MTDVRIRFRKRGNARYISHLDLTRTMTRALRRAGIPVWYTEGFNRHPYITFAAPLSLGFEGLSESMDIRLTGEMPMPELVRRLNAALPEGLEAYGAGVPAMKPGDIASARYRLTFRGDMGGLDAFLSQESIPAGKKSKKGAVRQIELKPLLERAAWSPSGDGGVLELILPCGNETVNPALIVGAYAEFREKQSGRPPLFACDTLRLELLDAAGRPFA